MTPVYHYPGVGTLWLGGQNAANDTDMLQANRITTRFSAKETYACKRTEGIQDWQPFRIDDILSKGVGGYHDWIKVKQRVIDIEEALRRGENILVLCKQGARRSATVVGVYLMAKTGATGKEVYDYLRAVRAVVEDILLWNLEHGPGRLQLHVDWIEQKGRLPMVLPLSECLRAVGEDLRKKPRRRCHKKS